MPNCPNCGDILERLPPGDKIADYVCKNQYCQEMYTAEFLKARGFL